MKQLIRRLSRVSDSSQYFLLRSDASSPAQPTPEARRSKPKSSKARRSQAPSSGGLVPQGHLPVYVGEEMERFVVRADFLKHPIFIQLLERSAQEYGYEQQGVLRIPCRVLLFQRVLEILKDGDEIDAGHVDELFRLFSTEDFL